MHSTDTTISLYESCLRKNYDVVIGTFHSKLNTNLEVSDKDASFCYVLSFFITFVTDKTFNDYVKRRN